MTYELSDSLYNIALLRVEEFWRHGGGWELRCQGSRKIRHRRLVPSGFWNL